MTTIDELQVLVEAAEVDGVKDPAVFIPPEDAKELYSGRRFSASSEMMGMAVHVDPALEETIIRSESAQDRREFFDRSPPTKHVREVVEANVEKTTWSNELKGVEMTRYYLCAWFEVTDVNVTVNHPQYEKIAPEATFDADAMRVKFGMEQDNLILDEEGVLRSLAEKVRDTVGGKHRKCLTTDCTVSSLAWPTADSAIEPLRRIHYGTKTFDLGGLLTRPVHFGDRNPAKVEFAGSMAPREVLPEELAEEDGDDKVVLGG